MAENDILEKVLMSYADVFADCVNALVYEGKRKLRAEELQRAPTESFYQGRERIHNQFCDVGFFRIQDNAIQAHYIIENEMRLRRRQVFRKVSYVGGAYRGQLESGQRVYPVISVILDWKRKTSRIPLSLRELLKKDGVSQDDLVLADDIKLTVYHMRKLPEEVRSRFVSDMGFLADYLNDGSFDRRRNQKIMHVEALCKMMRALTGDVRFTNLVEEMLQRQRKGEEILMCEYIDMLEAKGQERGEKIGEERGENKLASLLDRLYSLKREEDARLAVQDKQMRRKLYEEFGMAY